MLGHNVESILTAGSASPVFGEVESMGTSTRTMERLPLRNNAVFRTLLRPGKPGQASKPPLFTKTGQEPSLICKTKPDVRAFGLVAHRITSSAWKRTEGGMVRPSAWAVLRLMTSSKMMGCSTGRSAGMVPFKILST
jgi:hypothetical protein